MKNEWMNQKNFQFRQLSRSLQNSIQSRFELVQPQELPIG
jgi:hypothetical protein